MAEASPAAVPFLAGLPWACLGLFGLEPLQAQSMALALEGIATVRCGHTVFFVPVTPSTAGYEIVCIGTAAITPGNHMIEPSALIRQCQPTVTAPILIPLENLNSLISKRIPSCVEFTWWQSAFLWQKRVAPCTASLLSPLVLARDELAIQETTTCLPYHTTP